MPNKGNNIYLRKDGCLEGQYLRCLCENPTPCHLGILLCLYTGLRIGEICAMKWKDICINEQYLYVHQTMQRIQTHNSTKGKTEIVILPPKSECSIRYIPIPSDIIQLLMPVQRQEEAFLLTGMAHSFIEPSVAFLSII